jgi:hypothetical protein
MAKAKPGKGSPEDAVSLISSSEDDSAGSVAPTEESRWTRNAYVELVNRLDHLGYLAQAAVIRKASENGGFISREQLLEVAGYHAGRSLQRFSLPAARLSVELAQEGLVDAEAARPLTAVYEGPGRTIGYEVPEEFVEFEETLEESKQRTWLEAAVQVARADPTKAWKVSELIEGIDRLGLRDLSNARTPLATLSRDLQSRQTGLFTPLGDGTYKLIDSSDPGR